MPPVPTIPQAGLPVEASWGQQVVNALVPRFPDAAGLNGWGAPNGAMATTPDSLWMRHNGAWRRVMTFAANGGPYVGIGGLNVEGPLYVAGTIVGTDKLTVGGDLGAATISARDNLSVAGDGNANRFLANYLHSYGGLGVVGAADIGSLGVRSTIWADGRVQAENFYADDSSFFAASHLMRFYAAGVEAGQFQLTNHYSTPNTMFRIGGRDGRPAVWLLMTGQFGLMFMSCDPNNYDWTGALPVPIWAGAYNAQSDARTKSDIADAPEGMLEKVCRVKPKRYKRHGSDTHEVGLVAQDVHEAMPDAAAGTDDLLGYSVTGVLAHLMGAVQELTARVEAQAATIKALEARLAAAGA